MKRKIKREADKQKPKITKVIHILDNGRVHYLEGEDVQKYFDHINSALSFMQVTRSYMLPKDFLKVDWKEIDKSKIAQLVS